MLSVLSASLTLEQPLKVQSLAFKQFFETAIFKQKLLDAIFQLIDLCSMRVSVYYRLVLYIHSLAGIFNCVETFLVVGFAGTHACNHKSVRVAP